jgi:hypothetical protein
MYVTNLPNFMARVFFTGRHCVLTYGAGLFHRSSLRPYDVRYEPSEFYGAGLFFTGRH